MNYFLGHPAYIGSLYLKKPKSCDVTRLSLHTFRLPPLGVGGSSTLGWYWRRREGADIFLKRETCWTSFFPCHGLATAGGEQCNQPPWENIVVRPPLMMLDWIWRHAGGGDSERTKRGELCLWANTLRGCFFRSILKVVSLLKRCQVKTCFCCPREQRIRDVSLLFIGGSEILFLFGH